MKWFSYALVLGISLGVGSIGGIIAVGLSFDRTCFRESSSLGCWREIGKWGRAFHPYRKELKEASKRLKNAWLVVMIFTVGSFLALYKHFGLGFTGFFHLIIAFHFCLLAGTDVMHGLLPNRILLSATVFMFLFHLRTKVWSGLNSGLLGASIGLALFYLISAIRPGAMGGGDIKMAGAMGLYLGFPRIVPAFGLAFVLASAYCLPLLILKRLKKTDTIPLGVFLSFATIYMSMTA